MIAPPEDEFDAEARERERRRAEREARRSALERGEQPPPSRRKAPKMPPIGAKLSETAEVARDRLALRERRGRPKRSRRGFVAIAVVVGLLIVVGAFLIALFQPFAGEGLGEGKVTVKIPKGSSASEVADILDDAGVVGSSMLMQIRLALGGGREELQAGNFTLGEGMSYEAAIEALKIPPQQRVTSVTLPEGLSRDEVAPVAEGAGIEGNYEKATLDASDYSFDPSEYEAKGIDSLEGFLFPATYDLPAKATVEDLVQRQLDAFAENASGVDFGPAAEKNLTPYEVIIIASLIEREAQLNEERELISAVIYNRLAADELLGIDATTRFAVGNFDSPLTQSELESDSPYNTRVVPGLPPGPIGNPGLASIEAAAHPADVDYLFYVAKPGTCGEHNFATTLEEHNANVAEYDEAREAAGGKSPDTC